MKANLTVTTVLCSLLVLASCGANSPVSPADSPVTPASPVDLVQQGTLPGHNETTIGKAFNATFQGAKWTSYETPKGVTVVEFNGVAIADDLEKGGVVLLSDTKTNDCIDGVPKFEWTPCRLPMKFQFTLSADKKTFGLTSFTPYIPSERWLNSLLAYIYR